MSSYLKKLYLLDTVITKILTRKLRYKKFLEILKICYKKNTYKQIKVHDIFRVLRKYVTRKILTRIISVKILLHKIIYKKLCYPKLFMFLDIVIKNTYRKIKV